MFFQYEADGDVDMEASVRQPVYEFTKDPMLLSCDHTVLIKWMRDRVQYDTKLRERCATSLEQYEAIDVSVKSSIEPSKFVSIRMYDLERLVVVVTEAEILQAIKQRCWSLKNEYVPDLDHLFARELRMDLCLDDVGA